MAHHRCIVYLTDHTKPAPSQLEQIILSAGGKMLLIKDPSFYDHIDDTDSKHICIADVEDVNTRSADLSIRFEALKKRNIDILSMEFFLTMVMQQEWPRPENYVIPM